MSRRAQSSRSETAAVIRIYALDGFRLEHGSWPALPARTNSRPLLLLKLLVTLGGEAVVLDLLCEPCGATLTATVLATLSIPPSGDFGRLIGHDTVRLDGGRLSLAMDRCWVDACAFSEALEQAGKATRSGDVPAVHRQLGIALDLYRRPFLHGEAERPLSWPRATAFRHARDAICATPESS